MNNFKRQKFNKYTSLILLEFMQIQKINTYTIFKALNYRDTNKYANFILQPSPLDVSLPNSVISLISFTLHLC